nr:glycosyltransferase family 2 protein [uncultured Rhodopila sp.]
MTSSVGIGIITHNRKDAVRVTIERVRRHTQEPGAVMVVADDGSSDGTAEMLCDMRVPVVTGVRMGVAWNKNRALFLLCQILQCESAILLEDDTCPSAPGWEQPWMQAVARWGHVNFAPPFYDEQFIVSGAGTPDDPLLSKIVTAQCSAFSATAIAYGGYYDSRFQGFGHEHVEHTRRLVRIGYGGTDRRVDGVEEVRWRMLRGDLEMQQVPSTVNAEELQRNWTLAQTLMATEGYRAPWQTDQEMRQFRDEIDGAMVDGPDRFLIRPRGRQPDSPPAVTRQGILARWFKRA